MTIPAELVAPLLAAISVVFAAWTIYEHRRISGNEATTHDGLVKVAADDSARHLDTLQAMIEQSEHLGSRISALEAPHEHGKHTHELVTASRHQEGGHLVLVKKCAVPGCEHVFRDAQD